jgi:hypothetical protein
MKLIAVSVWNPQHGSWDTPFVDHAERIAPIFAWLLQSH